MTQISSEYINDDWDKEIGDLVNTGKGLVHSQDLQGIIEFRFRLASYRGWVMKRWAEFDQAYSMSKWEFMQSDPKNSATKAEAYADTLAISRYRHQAKEWLETINQILNACASAITVLAKEKTEGNLDSPKL